MKAGRSLKMTASTRSWAEALENGGVLGRLRLQCHRVLNGQRFDAAIGFVILLNSISIGLESHFELKRGPDGVPKFFKVTEHLFLLVYVVELSMRFFAHRLGALESG